MKKIFKLLLLGTLFVALAVNAIAQTTADDVISVARKYIGFDAEVVEKEQVVPPKASTVRGSLATYTAISVSTSPARLPDSGTTDAA